MKQITDEDLKKILKMMFFFVGKEITKNFNFKKQNWFNKYSWTEKDEEKFINWLSGFFREGSYKRVSKKYSDKLAIEFVGKYGWNIRQLTIKDFTPVITDEQLKGIMSKREYDKFIKWMFGQTYCLYGYYRWDVERFLNGDKSWD